MISKIVKYILWAMFIGLFSLLFVWLAKWNWDLWWYVNFLNQKDRADAWKQKSVSYMFWSDKLSQEDIDSVLLTGEILTGDLELSDWELENITWENNNVDVFDPDFEKDFMQINDSDMIDTGVDNTDGGFVGYDLEQSDEIDQNVLTWDTKAQLLEMIKNTN